MEKTLKIVDFFGHIMLEEPDREKGDISALIEPAKAEVRLDDGNFYPFTTETGPMRVSGHGESSPAYCHAYAETKLGRVKLQKGREYLFRL